MNTTETIRELTQSAIAILVVGGGGVILYLEPTSQAIAFITGIMGMVAGYYFNRSSQAAGANAVLRAQGDR